VGTIYSLVDRTILLSQPNSVKKNLEMLVEVLLNNGYPLEMIFNSRIKKFLSSGVAHKSLQNNEKHENTNVSL